MPRQRDVIKDIDKKSTATVELSSMNTNNIGYITILRIIFIPAARFFRSIIFSQGLIRGMAGFKRSVNAWAEEFITEAKRYEKTFKDETRPVKDSRDFL